MGQLSSPFTSPFSPCKSQHHGGYFINIRFHAFLEFCNARFNLHIGVSGTAFSVLKCYWRFICLHELKKRKENIQEKNEKK